MGFSSHWNKQICTNVFNESTCLIMNTSLSYILRERYVLWIYYQILRCQISLIWNWDWEISCARIWYSCNWWNTQNPNLVRSKTCMFDQKLGLSSNGPSHIDESVSLCHAKSTDHWNESFWIFKWGLIYYFLCAESE